MKRELYISFPILAVIGAVFSFLSHSLAQSPVSTYVFTTFDGTATPAPGMQILFSSDGIDFNSTQSTWHFTDTNVRDPEIIKIGKWYYVLYTTSYPSSTTKLGMKKSQDLVNWTTVQTPDFAYLWTGNESQIWVGCWLYDNGVYYIYFCTAPNTQRPYVMTFDPATDTFGVPQPVGIDSPPAKIDLMSVLKVGDTYHAFIQDNNSNNGGFYITHATSSNPLTGWTITDSGNWAGWGEAEAPQLCVKSDGTYRMYLISFPNNHYTYYSESSDLKTWTSIQPINAACWNGHRPGNGWVAVFQPPSITSTDSATFVVGQPGHFSLQTTGTPVLSAVGLPSWASLNSTTDMISGTPTQTGTYSFAIDATNGINPAATQPFTLTVLLPLAQWSQTYFTAEQLQHPEISGPTAIPQKDSIPNLLKYLCDINPAVPMTAADRAALPQSGLESDESGTYLTLTHRQNKWMTGLTVSLETSTDLADWQTTYPDRIEGVGLDSLTGDPIIKYCVNTAGSGRKFLRMRVMEP